MSHEEVLKMMEEMGLPFAYDHFVEGGSGGAALPCIFISQSRQFFGGRDRIFQNKPVRHRALHRPEEPGTGGNHRGGTSQIRHFLWENRNVDRVGKAV